MRIVMINDCAFVGETLAKYLPTCYEVLHLKRTRRLLDKTFGIAWRIFRSKGDLYHVHYLLQDCYFALKLGKRPIIGHAHGSDLREVIKSSRWGRIVRDNLRRCDKILVAQPTILAVARAFNDSAEYLPIPYDPEIFYPKPLQKERDVKHVLLASPHNFEVKGTDKFLQALAAVDIPLEVETIGLGKDLKIAIELARKLGVKMKLIDPISHDRMNELYWRSDLVMCSFGVGQLDTVAIEAMACGRPVVHHILASFYPDSCPLEEFREIRHVTDVVTQLLNDRERAQRRIREQLTYVEKFHSALALTEKLVKIYDMALK
jgi:glycosyltransferase involved in cell wall biosynthesis